MKKILMSLAVLIILGLLGLGIWKIFLDKAPESEIIFIPVNEVVLEETVETRFIASEEEETVETRFIASEIEEEFVEETVSEEAETLAVTVPGEMKLDVMFSTQAPLKDWGMPYQEACEEASLIMAYYYFAEKYLDRPIMNDEILDLVAWEEERFGYYKDTTLAETQMVADEYFSLDTEMTTNVTEENIKYQLNQGNLLVLPFAGKMLENKYFSGDGPLFHMLLVKGYDHKNFITNDPGLLTLGENFEYSYKNLLESVHDWNGGEVNSGRRVMLIVKGMQ